MEKCDCCKMDYVEIVNFIHEHLELVDIELMRNIGVAIKNYMTKNDITEEAVSNATPVSINKKGEIVDIAGNVIEFSDEDESENESEEEEGKKQLVITKKDGKTKVVINL